MVPHTGENVPQTGSWRCASCGETVDIGQGEHLPPCPRERKAVEWEMARAA